MKRFLYIYKLIVVATIFGGLKFDGVQQEFQQLSLGGGLDLIECILFYCISLDQFNYTTDDGCVTSESRLEFNNIYSYFS